MSNEQQDDWVQAQTPREEEVPEEQSEYGQAFEPDAWDDYASEQSAQVPPPQPRPTPVAQPEPDVDGDADQEPPASEAVPADPPSQDTADGGVEHAATADLAEEQLPEPDPVDEPSHPEADADAEPAPRPGDTHTPVADAHVEEFAVEEVDTQQAEPEQIDSEPFVAASEQPASEFARPEPDAPAWSQDIETTAVRESPARAAEPETAPEGDQTTADLGGDESEQDLGDDQTAADEEPIRAVPVASLPDADAVMGTSAGATTADPIAGLYRSPSAASPAEASEQTQVLEAQTLPEVDEQELEERRIQEQLAAERQARRERLGVVETSEENATRSPLTKPKRTTDKFAGAFGLFILRLVSAAVLGVTGYQMLTPVEETAAIFETTLMPEPELMAWILGFTLSTLAVLLVLGLLQRVVGLLMMVYSIGLLALFRWGDFNPFREQFEGFAGDKELLLAGIGFLLLMVGGGSWGIDGAVRRGRAKAKAQRQD